MGASGRATGYVGASGQWGTMRRPVSSAAAHPRQSGRGDADPSVGHRMGRGRWAARHPTGRRGTRRAVGAHIPQPWVMDQRAGRPGSTTPWATPHGRCCPPHPPAAARTSNGGAGQASRSSNSGTRAPTPGPARSWTSRTSCGTGCAPDTSRRWPSARTASTRRRDGRRTASGDPLGRDAGRATSPGHRRGSRCVRPRARGRDPIAVSLGRHRRSRGRRAVPRAADNARPAVLDTRARTRPNPRGPSTRNSGPAAATAGSARASSGRPARTCR